MRNLRSNVSPAPKFDGRQGIPIPAAFWADERVCQQDRTAQQTSWRYPLSEDHDACRKVVTDGALQPPAISALNFFLGKPCLYYAQTIDSTDHNPQRRV
jgi:hypothetical protein